MTYVPSAYVITNKGQYRVVLITPSGVRAVLLVEYPSQPAAEKAVETLGFRLVDFKGVAKTREGTS